MGVEISIVGARSAEFSLSLIKDICLTPNLKDSVVSLMDMSRVANPVLAGVTYLNRK